MTYEIKEFKKLKETSEIKAKVAIDIKDFAKYTEKALSHFSKSLKVDGFRTGKIPKAVVIKNVGMHAIVEEAANLAIKDTYPKVLKEKEVLIIDAPMITVSKLPADTESNKNKGKDGKKQDDAEGFEYILTAPVPPTFKLPDYKKLAKSIFGKKLSIKVTEKELDETTLYLRKKRKQIELIQNGKAPEEAQKEAEETKEKDLPELDDEFLKTLGGFKTMKEFRIHLKETIQKEKEAKELNKRRAEWVEQIVKETEIILPIVLISHEMDRLKTQFENDLKQVGSDLKAYLKSANKTQEQFMEEIKPQAIKQAKLQLILNQIAQNENLIPEEKQVEAELKHLLKHYKDANIDSARAYVTMQIRNKMVFDFLEKQR